MKANLPNSWYRLLFVALLVATILVYRVIFAPRELRVTVLDVEQGTAILVETPGNHTVLIDTGPDRSILRALGLTLSYAKRHIDLVLLTSTKAAQIGGLPDLSARYRVGEQVQIGNAATPYGAPLTLDGTSITVPAPGQVTISDNSRVLSVSSSTPKGRL